MKICKALYTTAIITISTSTTLAADNGAARIPIEIAEKAIAKGYGAMCSLNMMPVETDGYYPCIDMGPYRYVREYQRVSAFVLVKDAPPFKILGGTSDNPKFIVGGPWETDLAQRAVQYWNDIVEGGAASREKTQQESKARDNAASFIQNQIDKEAQETQKHPEPTPNAGNDVNSKSDAKQGTAKDNDLRSLLSQTQ